MYMQYLFTVRFHPAHFGLRSHGLRGSPKYLCIASYINKKQPAIHNDSTAISNNTTADSVPPDCLIWFQDLVKLPTPPGGYSQWQSQTVARKEGKCRVPSFNLNSTRDQNTGPFSNRKIKEVFSAIDPKQGYLGSVCPKER